MNKDKRLPGKFLSEESRAQLEQEAQELAPPGSLDPADVHQAYRLRLLNHQKRLRYLRPPLVWAH